MLCYVMLCHITCCNSLCYAVPSAPPLTTSNSVSFYIICISLYDRMQLYSTRLSPIQYYSIPFYAILLNLLLFSTIQSSICPCDDHQQGEHGYGEC